MFSYFLYINTDEIPNHFTLQSSLVKRTFQDFINEFVIQKLNLLVIAAMNIKLKSAFMLVQIEVTLIGQNIIASKTFLHQVIKKN